MGDELISEYEEKKCNKKNGLHDVSVYNNDHKLICELAEKQEIFIDIEKYLSKDIIKLTLKFLWTNLKRKRILYLSEYSKLFPEKEKLYA